MPVSNSFFDWASSLVRFIPRDTARAEDVNDALDEVSNGFTDVEALTNAAIKLSAGETSVALGNAASRLGKVLSFNAATGAAEAVITGADIANAQTNAGAAAASAAAAAASYDSFDDRYLGAKAVAPVLDNDGAALITGAVYWDTTIPGWRVWDGAAWVTLPSTTAASILNTPAGNIAATNVQAALNELDTEKAALAGSASQSFSAYNFAPNVSGSIGSLYYDGGWKGRYSSTGSIWGLVSTNDSSGRLSLMQAIATTVDGAVSPARTINMFPTGEITIPGTLSLTGASSTLGYGTGSGGTVTQATSKSTAVTLNRPNGWITMNTESLAAGATVSFRVNNSVAADASNVVLALRYTGLALGSYTAQVEAIGTGFFDVSLKNNTAGALAYGVLLVFSVLGGSST